MKNTNNNNSIQSVARGVAQCQPPYRLQLHAAPDNNILSSRVGRLLKG